MRIVHADDLRLAVRRLLKRPGIALASVFALACGIGAAAATWSLFSSLLLNPLPVESPERLFLAGQQLRVRPGEFRTTNVLVYPEVMSIRDAGVFEAVAAGGGWDLLVTEPGGVPRTRTVFFASHDFFSILGVRLARGRGFRPDEDRRGAALVAVLSDRYWRRAFNADPQVIGQTIRVGQASFDGDGGARQVTIVGIAPAGFRGLDLAASPDLYLPLNTVADVGDPKTINYFAEPIGNPPVRSSPTAWVQAIGRLKAGDTPADASRRLSAALDRRTTYDFTNVNTAAIPEAARAGMTQFTQLLSITVGLLLLTGCLTVAMLLLVRTEDRSDEFAVCLALGASRLRLARSVALEGALLAAAGALLAIPVADWLFALIATFQLPGRVEIERLELSLDRTVWVAAAASAIGLTWLAALVAGVLGFRADTATALHARGGATARVRRPARAELVAAQVAVTLVLVAGAGLFARSLMTALSLNTRVDTSRVATGAVSLAPYGYTVPRATEFFDELRRRLNQVPSIASVSMIVREGGMGALGKIVVDGTPRQFPSMVYYTAIDDTYFSTLGLPLLAGRGFSRGDTAQSPLAVIVSESFGRLIADGQSPIGHRISETSARRGQPLAVAEVVGVVPDVITNVSDPAPLVKYYALAQRDPRQTRTVVVRAAEDGGDAVRDVMSTIRDLDSTLTPAPMMTINEQIGRQMNPQRFGIYVLGALGAVALLLTVLGTYVIAASMASMRRREMTIRASLGATRAQLGGLVVRETAMLVGVGIGAGLVLTWLGAGTIRALLYRIEPLDPVTLASVAALILGCALLVCLRPALEVARVDMMRALREE